MRCRKSLSGNTDRYISRIDASDQLYSSICTGDAFGS